VFGRHRLVVASEQSPCNIDGICLEAVGCASVHCGVEKVTVEGLTVPQNVGNNYKFTWCCILEDL
jgi:hypothetical protein